MVDTTASARTAQCVTCQRTVHRSASSAREIKCLDCRRKYPNHGSASTYRQGCRCRPCKDAVAAKSREYAEQRKREGRPLGDARRRVATTCAGCGVAITVRVDTLKPTGNYCSHECHTEAQTTTGRRAHDRARKGRRVTRTLRERASRRAERAALGTTGGARVWVQGNCIICSTPFLSPGAASRYCSPRCRQKNRGSRTFGITWLDRMALYARDNWTCQICGEPVDYTAEPTSDWYPSVDHITPRSHGGTHDWDNLRCAHKWCNSVRGDLSHYTDADLAPTGRYTPPTHHHGYPAA